MLMPNNNHRTQVNLNNYAAKTQTEKIADHLIFLLRIPDGNELVPYFGTGFEASNREALITWVDNMYPDIDTDEAEGRLEQLVTSKLRNVRSEGL